MRDAEPIDERRREDLHVTGQDDELDAGLGGQLGQAIFLRGPVVTTHGKMVEGDPESLGGRRAGRVIAGHEGDTGRQVAGGRTAQQVVETVHLLGGEDGDRARLVRVAKLPLHAQRVGDRSEGVGETPPVEVEAGQAELDALEEHARLIVRVLVGVHDVAAVAGHETGHGGDEAWSIRRRDE